MSNPQVAQVLQVLSAAASGDASLRVPAHKQLQELETRPGFAGLLLEAYADSAANQQGRYLAILMSKNVVERQWQPRYNSQGLTGEEKTFTKDRLLTLLKAAVHGQLPYFVELTMVVRKVCRFDFPKQWDELAHFIMDELQRVHESGFDETTLAVVMVLHHVLKEQATKKLLSARKEMHQIGQVLTEPLGRVWCSLLERLRQDQGPLDDRQWKLSRYLDGCFLILLTQGFAHLHESPTGPQMIVLARSKVVLLLSRLRSHGQTMVQRSFFLKNLKSVLKWWALLLHAHPIAFSQANVAEVLQCSVEVLQTYAVPTSDPQLRPIVESFLKSSLQTITHAFNSVAFRKGPQQAHQGAALEAAGACHTQFAEFLQGHPVASLCELSCRAALSLSAEDVQAWLEDPEDQLLGPSTQTELHSAGENCIRSLGQTPLEQPLIEHIARRLSEDQATPPTPNDAFDVVVRRDALLSVLCLCQPLLRSHVKFQQLLAFFAPVAALVGGKQVASVLLPVRLCAVLRSWTAEIPADLVLPVLQLLQGFLQDTCPKALRLAALGPLRSLLDRFSDNEAWSEMQGPLIDSCWALLSNLQSPEVQWRCLNLIHLFLCEEAENGRYEATERALQQLLLMWRQPESGEGLICHALLDVLQALVLMSDHTKKPRLPLSRPLLSCCLMVISDCYTRGDPRQTAALLASVGGQSAGAAEAAALEADAGAALGRVGETGMVSAKLFESGSVLLLGVLRTVDDSQALELVQLLPKLMAICGDQTADSLFEGAMDLLLEQAALCVTLGAPGIAVLRPHYWSLAQLCHQCLKGEQKGRHHEHSLELLSLLLAHADSPESLARLRGEAVAPLFKLWSSAFDPMGSVGSFHYPLQPLVQLFCSWHAAAEPDFRQHGAVSEGGRATAALMVGACKLLRPLNLRAATLVAAISLVDERVAADSGFWQDFLKCCDELISATQKKTASVLLAQSLQCMRSAKLPVSHGSCVSDFDLPIFGQRGGGAKLPAPTRRVGELQRCMLPQQLRAALKEDGTVDEVAVVHWFFDRAALALRQLGLQGGLNLQALLGAAPAQVQAAFKTSGI